MKQLDRYILRQLFGPFAFFMLVFVGLLWLNQALSKIDIVIENGQPARIFLELSFYLLPRVLEIATPVSAFAASVMVTNKLYGESELVVMMNAGLSTKQLAIPYLVFGTFCGLLLALVTHWAEPTARKALLDRQDEISRQYVTQIVKQGEFVSDDDRFTFYFGEKGQNGELVDILIAEQVNDDLTISHVAQKGQAVNTDGATKLLLFNGSIQEFRKSTQALSVIQFESLSYDLSQFGDQIAQRTRVVEEYSTTGLVEELTSGFQPAFASERIQGELHARFVQPLLTMLIPALGMAVLLVGGFSRRGFLPRIIVAVVLMFSIDAIRGMAASRVEGGDSHWAVIYLPIPLTVVIIALCFLLTRRNGTSFKLRRLSKVAG